MKKYKKMILKLKIKKMSKKINKKIYNNDFKLI